MTRERNVTRARSSTYVWLEDWGDSSPGLSPREVPEVWRKGLKAAGARNAKIAKVYRGQWMTLPLVVQFDCPFDHVDDSGERWAKVLLRVNPRTGWVSLHEDSCSRCAVHRIEEWLITCPSCAAGVDSDEHPEHGMFMYDEGDDSPLAFVLNEMNRLMFSDPRDPSPRDAERDDEPQWTPAAVVDWLDKLVHEDGSHVVPPTTGQAAAWEAVRVISPHPSQSLVRDAQATRKKAAMEPPAG